MPTAAMPRFGCTQGYRSHLLPPTLGIPNNPHLPLVLYRGCIDVATCSDPETAFIRLFHDHGWGEIWTGSVFPWHHFHATAHEVLGVAEGTGRIQFGGPVGPVLGLSAGDVAVIPAGVAHACVVDAGLSVVGAYPDGQKADLMVPGEGHPNDVMRMIASVPLPLDDPVFGARGALILEWDMR